MTTKNNETRLAASSVTQKQEWRRYGEPIGNSRWFNAMPSIELDAEHNVIWRCPVTPCAGSMRATGAIWATGNPGHHHRCDCCGFTAAIKGAVFSPEEHR